LGGEGFEDDSFHLAQVAAGQAVGSPAVDFAPVLVQGSDLAGWSTRSDGGPDSDRLDLGFHYGTPSVALEWLNGDRPESADDRGYPDFCYPEQAADTDGLDLGYHYATPSAPLEWLNSARPESARDGGVPDFCHPDDSDPCKVGDCNDDGQVTVDELVTGVGIALGTIDRGACAPADRNEDGQVTVDELLAAINLALGLVC
jgi:hypothetical protein